MLHATFSKSDDKSIETISIHGNESFHFLTGNIKNLKLETIKEWNTNKKYIPFSKIFSLYKNKPAWKEISSVDNKTPSHTIPLIPIQQAAISLASTEKILLSEIQKNAISLFDVNGQLFIQKNDIFIIINNLQKSS